ncbi:hypothetical protein [Rickettsia endosymbiont of Orchestes rusci]
MPRRDFVPPRNDDSGIHAITPSHIGALWHGSIKATVCHSS